jgi:hypothetical protein
MSSDFAGHCSPLKTPFLTWMLRDTVNRRRGVGTGFAPTLTRRRMKEFSTPPTTKHDNVTISMMARNLGPGITGAQGSAR